MNYQESSSLHNQLTRIQKDLNKYQNLTKAAMNYQKISKHITVQAKVAASLTSKTFIYNSAAFQKVAREAKYASTLSSKTMSISMHESMILPTIKLSSRITNSYLNSPAVNEVCKTIQRLQNTYTSSMQQQAVELISAFPKILSTFGYSDSFDVDDFEFEQDTISIPEKFVCVISDILKNSKDVLLSVKGKVSIRLFITITTTILSALGTHCLYVQNKLQDKSNKINQQQLDYNKKATNLQLKQKDRELNLKQRELDQKDRELDQKDRELDLKDKELQLKKNKAKN